MKKIITAIMVLTFIISCKDNTPQNLTSITYSEMVNMTTAGQLKLSDDVKYYDIDSALLTDVQRKEKSNELPYAAWFIDEDSTLVKVHFQDRQAAAQAQRAAAQAQKNKPLIKSDKDINCNSLTSLLERIYDRDQDNRTSGDMDSAIDDENLVVVEKIMEKCGLPTAQAAGSQGVSAMWLVIQHASGEKRKKYFPQFLQAQKRGDISASNIALMQDRMLMDDGEPQLYGSQVRTNEQGEYELYDLQNPETVNARRATMGLPPLNEYLSNWEIEFDVPQKTN